MIRCLRDVIWWVLKRKGVTKGYIDMVKDMEVLPLATTTRSPVGKTSEFAITLGYTKGPL